MYSRRVVGWQTSKSLRSDLALNEAAYYRQNTPALEPVT